MAKVTYKDSGVDVDAGKLFVKLIEPLAKPTYKTKVSGKIGSFSGFYIFPKKKYKDPVLVASTDGVGTKLRVAYATGKLDTIGIDLVAMNVNDVVTCGAEPLFFLDYIATSKLNPQKGAEIVKGIVRGCKEAGCVLLGGETAEMPGFYKRDEFDLAGFVVGVVNKKELIDGSSVKEGDQIIGMSSNGLHSNGYSLARKVLFEKSKLKLSDKPSPLKSTVGEELMKPTKIYVRTVLSLKKTFKINAIAHITGGGLIENVPRVVPKGLKAVLDSSLWRLPSIFKLIKMKGRIDEVEMYRTFNCGIGMISIISSTDTDRVLRKLRNLKEKAMVIGEIRKRKRGEPGVLID